MRSYSVAVASLAIGAPARWTDNLLSQHRLPDVISSRHGVPRRIGYLAVVRLGLVRELHTQLGIGVADAVAIAARMLDSESDGVHSAGMLSVRVDVSALERRIQQRLAEALESAPTPRRGRPPSRASM